MTHTKGTLTHKRWLCALLVAAMLCALAIPAMASGFGVVRNPNGGSYVNLREWGSYSAPILTRVAVGATVEIVRTDGDWYLVRMGDAVGFMHSAFVSKGASSAPQTGNATVTVGPLNLRETASTSARVLTQLASGVRVNVLWRGDAWSQVSVNGLTGYLLNSYLSFDGSTPSAPIVTENANATIRTKNGGRLNLRASASTASQVLGSYASGTRVRVLTHGASWCKVQIGGTVGYLSSAYLAFDSASSATSGATYPAVVNNPKATQVLNLRERPDTESRSLGQYRNGTAVTVLGMGTQWLRVRVGGVEGYMQARYVKVNSASATPHKTVNNAAGRYVNLREGPGYEHTVLRRVNHGEAASVVIPYPVWSKVIVKTDAGFQSGYMLNSFLK